MLLLYNMAGAEPIPPLGEGALRGIESARSRDEAS